MKRLLKAAAWFAVISAALSAAGALITSRMQRGGPEDDGFTVAAIFGGRVFGSRARPLTSGRAVAVLGGIDLDLSEASCGPEGVRLALHAVMGGIHVLVPRGWSIEVDDQIAGGGVQVRAGGGGNGAGRLHVTATGQAGGVMVEAAGDDG